MVIDSELLDLIQPAAPEILGIDAGAVAKVASKREEFKGLDWQPVATASAGQRRAIVATAMKEKMGPNFRWVLREEHLSSGAYEWIVGDYLVKLSKSTPESREAARGRLAGVQDQLFSMAPPAGTQKGTVLVRLMGNPLTTASVDIVPVSAKGIIGSPIPMSALAQANVEHLRPAAPEVPAPRVSLPRVSRTSRAD